MKGLPGIGDVLGVVEPLGDAIDNLTSGEERGKIRLAHIETKTAIAEKFLEMQAAVSAAQAQVLVADASGHSWIQRNARWLILLSLAATALWAIILGPIVQWLLTAWKPDLAPMPLVAVPAWIGAAITAGITVVGAGRSAEKITDKLVATDSISFGKGDGDDLTRRERKERKQLIRQLAKETDPERRAEILRLLDPD